MDTPITAAPAPTMDTAEPPAASTPAPMHAGHRAMRQRSNLWALLGSLALAGLYARASLLNLTTGVVGGDVDGYENIWNNYWVKTAIFDLHQNPYYTNQIYYPTGVSLRFHTLQFFTALVTMPFNLTLGYIPTINVLMVVLLALTTLFAFFLIRDLVGNPWAAFTGAALFTYANQKVVFFYLQGSTNLLSMQWIPVYLFFLFRALHGRPLWSHANGGPGRDTRRWRNYSVLAIGTLLIMSLTEWEYVMYSVLATLVYFAFVLFTRRPWRDKALVFSRLSLIGGIYALTAGPLLLLPMITEALNSPWLIQSQKSSFRAIDVIDLVSPGLGNPGYLAVGFALVGVLAARRRGQGEVALFWVVVSVIFYLLSFGPFLKVGGQETGITMPYAWLQSLPVISAGRDPGRFTILATLGVSVLAAFGLSAFLEWLPRVILHLRTRSLFSAASAAVVALFLLITLWGFAEAASNPRVDPPTWPEFYKQISSDKENYAILELPLFTVIGRGPGHYQMYQILHHKPRLSGRWSRDHTLDNPNNFVKNASLVRHLWLLDFPDDTRDFFYPEDDFLTRTDYERQGAQILNYYNVRYIIVYEQALSPRWAEAEFQELLAQVLGKDTRPVYVDDLMRVYRVPNAPLPADVLTLDVGNGWYAMGVNKSGTVYRWADNNGNHPSELYTMNLSGEPVRAILKGSIYTYKQARTVQVSINGYEAYTVQVMPEEVDKPVAFEITIPPGNNIITFTTPEPPRPTDNPDQDGRKLTFGMYDVELDIK